jgi:hypothetical protein
MPTIIDIERIDVPKPGVKMQVDESDPEFDLFPRYRLTAEARGSCDTFIVEYSGHAGYWGDPEDPSGYMYWEPRPQVEALAPGMCVDLVQYAALRRLAARNFNAEWRSFTDEFPKQSAQR